MGLIPENPFIVSGYVSPEYFCDREKDSKELLDALQNGRNIMLTSPRRMGKTGLIMHLFHQLRRQVPKVVIVYVDLFSTENLADFTRIFAASVFSVIESNPAKLLKRLTSLFKGLRPKLSFNPLTGQPEWSVDIVQGTESCSLEQIFDYLGQMDEECYIAFDEFQQIAQYPEKNVEALLRTRIQHLHNIHFIFSGSQAHILGEMFLSPKRPFYQSSSLKSIGTIDEHSYYSFAKAFFESQGRSLPEKVFDDVYSRYEGHTWYVQKVMNQLFGKKDRTIDEALVKEVVSEILQENEYYYISLLRAYSKGQVKLLKAVAKEEKVREILSGEFVSKYRLTASSSVKGALLRLMNDEVLYRSDQGYMVYDRFFGQWLAEKF